MPDTPNPAAVATATDWESLDFLATCARLPLRTRQAIVYLIEQAIEMERQGDQDLAVNMLESITFQLARSNSRKGWF